MYGNLGVKGFSSRAAYDAQGAALAVLPWVRAGMPGPSLGFRVSVIPGFNAPLGACRYAGSKLRVKGYRDSGF